MEIPTTKALLLAAALIAPQFIADVKKENGIEQKTNHSIERASKPHELNAVWFAYSETEQESGTDQSQA